MAVLLDPKRARAPRRPRAAKLPTRRGWCKRIVDGAREHGDVLRRADVVHHDSRVPLQPAQLRTLHRRVREPYGELLLRHRDQRPRNRPRIAIAGAGDRDDHRRRVGTNVSLGDADAVARTKTALAAEGYGVRCELNGNEKRADL